MSVMSYRWWAEVAGADVGKRPPSVVVLLTEDTGEGGYFLDAYDSHRRRTMPTTWHGARAAATSWAKSEHRPADLGPWREIPDAVSDAVGYAVEAATRRS